MNEFQIGTRAAIGIIGILIYAWLKVIGGRKDEDVPGRARWWKRFISPFFLSSFIILYSVVVHRFYWLYLLSIPTYIGETFIDGYGSNSTYFIAVIRRFLSALLFSSVSLLYAIHSQAMVIWVIQTFIGVAITVGFQFQKKQPAPAEELLIHFGRSFLIPFMV